jgi:type II restriction enzyme
VIFVFWTLLDEIFMVARLDFLTATNRLIDFIDTAENFPGILEQIGTIPESIDHDSTEEKLFAKASDAVLSRTFREIGFKSTVLKDRADSADVQVESPFYGYTMVADAKAFRMSRTAKNQKDFKVVALSGWRKDADYAVLCSPYFHYPRTQSQIYAQSIDHNVCLLSWEHLLFMVRNGIREDQNLNLSLFWNFSEIYSHTVIAAERKKCFLGEYNDSVLATINYEKSDFSMLLEEQIRKMSNRGAIEKEYWEKEKETILAYSKEEAIKELVKSRKIDEKIQQIDQFVKGLHSL